MSDAPLVAAWLKKHKRPRRFKRGESMNPTGLMFFLRDRGYEASFTGWRAGGKCRVKKHGAMGPGKNLDMHGVIALVDELRLAEGLEPFSVEASI